jgi:pSer/pThr/pTyr-binding forkhead associated (FHA) protein
MSSSPALTHKFLDGTEKVLPVGAKPIIIGRLPESEIQVHDAFISRVHAGISYSNQQYVLKDFGSTNGTYRNGARVFECVLTPGDRIQVGNTSWVFELDPVNGASVLRQVPQMTVPPRAPSITVPIAPIQKPPATPAP